MQTYLPTDSARVTTRLGAHSAFSLGRSGPSSLSRRLWCGGHDDYEDEGIRGECGVTKIQGEK